MGDRDVLERAMTLMPGSHMYDANDSRFAERGWSEAWMVRLNGPPAAEIMNAVRPWMGQRKDIHDRTRTPRMASHSFDSRACDLHRSGLRTTASRTRPLSPAHELVARPREGPHPQDHSAAIGRCRHMPSRPDAWSRFEASARLNR
jgi:hypothetical protein